MKLASYHVHTLFCDGSDSPEAMVRAAIDAGMTDLGFSAHAAWPFASKWHLNPSRYHEYIEEIRRLAREYAGKIRVFAGFEADYLRGVSMPDHGFYAPFAPDYIIGSVHYVPTKDRGRIAEPWSVDGPAEEVASGLQRCFDGDGEKAVRGYWELVRDMVETCRFDIIGHLDLPRKRNGQLKFFDESAPWYREELARTADVIAASNKIVELNTGAISRGAMDDVYPSAEMLGMLAERGARVTVCSDAHSPHDLVTAYDRAYRAAKNAGFTELAFLGEGGWVSEPIA